jgi:CheY-like chemotaxis protein
LIELFRELLETNGFSVIGEAYDGEDCITKLNNLGETPEFILMDHRMPNGNGLEVTKKLISKNPDLKIILMSADLSCEQEVLNAGAVKFIKKPFKIETLINAIHELKH